MTLHFKLSDSVKLIHRINSYTGATLCLDRLGALYSAAGTWESAITCYREILAVDCYREDVYRLLMGCYAACGRPADVKQTYLACRRCLRRDLHLPPAAETTMLYQPLIQQSTPLSVH